MFRVILAVSMLAVAASPAEARLFWQTYGSTVETPQGGCAWNLSGDYFVPRTCETGRYGLFSPCKQDRTPSPACRREHPIYKGFCTPYGACRYRWRDHVYKSYCGCTPQACCHGPWRNEYCGRCQPPLMRLCNRREDKQCCSAQSCSPQLYSPGCSDCTSGFCTDGCAAMLGSMIGSYQPHLVNAFLPNVEPLEVAVLGTLPVDSLKGASTQVGGQELNHGGAVPAIPPSGVAPPSFMIPSYGAAQPLTNTQSHKSAASPANKLPADTPPGVLQLLGVPPQ